MAKGIRVAEWLVAQNVDQVVMKEDLSRKGPGYVMANAGIRSSITSADRLDQAVEEALLAGRREYGEATLREHESRTKEGTSPMRNDREGTKKSDEIKAIKKSLTFYKFVVDSVPSGVITVDRDLRITGFNPWAERLTGYSAEEAVGTPCGEILQGGMCDTQCPLRIALTNQEPMSLVESTVRTKTGEIIPVRMNVAGLFDEKGDLIGGVESFQDISALKTLERERNNLISTFAHDMKSSLTIIGGFVLRLLHNSDTVDGQKEQRYLEIIRDESGKLEMLISDFLEFARLQTGRLKLNLSATSLDKELMESVRGLPTQGFQRRSHLGT